MPDLIYYLWLESSNDYGSTSYFSAINTHDIGILMIMFNGSDSMVLGVSIVVLKLRLVITLYRSFNGVRLIVIVSCVWRCFGHQITLII